MSSDVSRALWLVVVLLITVVGEGVLVWFIWTPMMIRGELFIGMFVLYLVSALMVPIALWLLWALGDGWLVDRSRTR